MARPTPIPVTILTGFLGAGKTTLLNHLLTHRHGRRIAVVENEFGEVGVDNALVIGATEEVVEMNNGCLCCTVRDDLVRALEKLARKRDKFDYLVIETSGLADPGPVMTTFLLHEGLQRDYQIDAVVTVADAVHLRDQLGRSPECERQIGFADVILLNKTDLVPAAELPPLEATVRGINRYAAVHRTERGVIEAGRIVGLRAFDLDNKKAFDAGLVAAPVEEPPYSSLRRYRLGAGAHALVFARAAHDHQGLVLLPLPVPPDAPPSAVAEATAAAEAEAAVIFEAEPLRREPGQTVAAVPFKQRLSLPPEGARYTWDLERAGWYLLLAGHRLDDYEFVLEGPSGPVAPEASRDWQDDGTHGAGEGSHRHDSNVRSIGIVDPRPVDGDLLSTWLGTLLQRRGNDIYRMKGIFHIEGSSQRFIFQGVHMLFEGKADRPWRPGETRQNQFVFIGRNLDRREIEAGFRSCLSLGL